MLTFAAPSVQAEPPMSNFISSIIDPAPACIGHPSAFRSIEHPQHQQNERHKKRESEGIKQESTVKEAGVRRDTSNRVPFLLEPFRVHADKILESTREICLKSRQQLTPKVEHMEPASTECNLRQ